MAGVIATSGTRLDEEHASEALTGLCSETEATQEAAGITLHARSAISDPEGLHVLSDGERTVLIYGYITSERTEPDAEFIDELFDTPEPTLAGLEGAFLIVAAAPETFLFATDKLGARLPYYTPTHPAVSTSVAALLPAVSEPTIDRQSVSDMLLLGHLWGDRTLVEEVNAGRPATVYEFDGEWSETRYWTPSLNSRDVDESYFQELSERYQTAVDRTAETLPSESSIWLSGGLDSRTTSAALSNSLESSEQTLSGLTYDANPPTGDNLRIAKRVADELGMDQTDVDLSASTFTADRVERVIDVCDGMVRWNTTLNLSAAYNITDRATVLMEGITGELLGDHLLQSHFRKADNVVDSQVMSEASASIDEVQSMLSIETDTLGTLREEARRADEESLWSRILDIHFQNYYSRLAYASNSVMRDVAGSRTPSVDGDLLEWISNLPLEYRKDTFPFTTGVPTGTSRAKLDLSRRMNNGVDEITYERTKMAPTKPYLLHVAGFLSNVVYGRLRSQETYGAGQLADLWLRSDTEIAAWAEEYMHDAADRDLFTDDVLEVWTAHQNGENNSPMIAQITTLEYWMQTHIDQD